jgi:hypothetical protein
MHVSMLLEPMQEPVQEPVQFALQLVLHSASPVVPLQLPMQVPMQLPVQFTEADAEQPPVQPASRLASHATCRFGGEHEALQPRVSDEEHISLPSTTAPPQSSKTFPVQSARAELAANETVAPATRARSEDQRNIRDLLRLECIPVRRGGVSFPSTTELRRIAACSL